MHVGLTGEFGAHRVSPRQLLAALQGRLVSQSSDLTPKIQSDAKTGYG